jgi:dTMP kinase
MNHKAKLFVFEGPDGVGKSTLCSKTTALLKEEGHACECFSFPGQDPGTLGNLVYKLHHDSSRFGVPTVTPTTLQTMHIAAHVDAIETRILPALSKGDVVLLDRYWWSTVVYGTMSGVRSTSLNAMVDLEVSVWNGVLPAIVFNIRRGKPLDRKFDDRIWEALNKNYHEIAMVESSKYEVVTVENDDQLQVVTERIIERMKVTH